MSDLAKNLLTQYYGLGSEATGKKFLSIHKSVEDAKNEEEKQISAEISLTTNEENVSEDESQDDIARKFSTTSESYRRPSRVFNNIEDAYDSDENSDTFEIDLGQNILCNVSENTLRSAPHELSSTIPATETRGNDSKDATGSDSSLTFVEDISRDNASDVSGATLKKSQKSSKTSTPLPLISKKKPVCNEIFADYSNTGSTQFPNEILNRFSQLRMLYMTDNSLTELPDEVFRSLRYLQWLDIRNNQLSSLPNSIESHPCIETLLLQGNKIVELPLELCTLSNLKTLQVTQNPLTVPPKDIVVLGFKEILKFLTIEWNKTYPERQVEVKESKIEPKLSTILCYQSPRKSKKKVTPYKNTVRNKIVSTREKRKSYKPSNRYYDKKSASSTNINYIFQRKSTDLCDSCLNKTIDPETSERQSNARETTKYSCSRIVNSWSKTCVRTEINNTNNKILRLMDPSPRSLYVRQNVKILKTYTKSLEKECRRKFSSAKLERVPPKIETKFSLVENNEKYNSTENIDQIFDIITNDRKRFKLHSLRLQNPDWMLSCLENYIGIVKCENKGANSSMEHRLLLTSKIKELFNTQASLLQKLKDQNVLKEWRRDRRSFNIAMEKAMKRNEDDIPFGFDPEDYASIFKQKPKSKICKQRFFPPENINKKISDILESMNQLKIETADGVTPRTKQNLLEKEMEKILQCRTEIQNLQKYNDVATVCLKN